MPSARCLLLVLVTPVLLCPRAGSDEVWLKSGVYLQGEVERMTEGKLVLDTPYAGTLTLQWEDVVNIAIERKLPFELKDSSRLVGRLDRGRGRICPIRTDKLQGHIRLSDISAINPPPQKPLTFRGFIRGGGVITDGNTRNREANAAGQLTARSERLRLLLKATWNFGENRKDDAGLFKRNTSGEIKMDFFVLQKAFFYANAFFESDKFKDLNLRTALGAGGGYQWIEEDHLSVFTEFGLSYVVDDKRSEKDSRSLSGRAAWKLDWVIVDKRVTFFHNGEFFISFESEKDAFLNTSTGMRFTVLAGFFASAQVDFSYDNTPSPGFVRRDFSYIFSLGYEF